MSCPCGGYAFMSLGGASAPLDQQSALQKQAEDGANITVMCFAAGRKTSLYS